VRRASVTAAADRSDEEVTPVGSIQALGGAPGAALDSRARHPRQRALSARRSASAQESVALGSTSAATGAAQTPEKPRTVESGALSQEPDTAGLGQSRRNRRNPPGWKRWHPAWRIGSGRRSRRSIGRHLELGRNGWHPARRSGSGRRSRRVIGRYLEPGRYRRHRARRIGPRRRNWRDIDRYLEPKRQIGCP
jgi:hypothetical protein